MSSFRRVIYSCIMSRRVIACINLAFLCTNDRMQRACGMQKYKYKHYKRCTIPKEIFNYCSALLLHTFYVFKKMQYLHNQRWKDKFVYCRCWYIYFLKKNFENASADMREDTSSETESQDHNNKMTSASELVW